MAHRRLYGFALVGVLVTALSSALAVAASVAREVGAAVDAFVTLALATFDPRPTPVFTGIATETPRVLGLHETRSFDARVMNRPGWNIPAGCGACT